MASLLAVKRQKISNFALVLVSLVNMFEDKTQLSINLGIIGVLLLGVGYGLWYFSYDQREYRMIKKARELYYRPNRVQDGYTWYLNEYPDGEYTKEAVNHLVDYYRKVEYLYDSNHHPKESERNKLHPILESLVAKEISKKYPTEENIEDHDIYYLQERNKRFLDGGGRYDLKIRIDNMGKRRPFRVTASKYTDHLKLFNETSSYVFSQGVRDSIR